MKYGILLIKKWAGNKSVITEMIDRSDSGTKKKQSNLVERSESLETRMKSGSGNSSRRLDMEWRTKHKLGMCTWDPGMC